jgi:hypothetical protein
VARQVLPAGADGGDLRIGEHGRRHPVVRVRAQVIGVGEVVDQRAGLGIGHVLELERRADVT